MVRTANLNLPKSDCVHTLVTVKKINGVFKLNGRLEYLGMVASGWVCGVGMCVFVHPATEWMLHNLEAIIFAPYH